MLHALFVLFVFALPAQAEDKRVTVTFLGGAKKVPLEGLKVMLRGSTGDNPRQRRCTAAVGLAHIA